MRYSEIIYKFLRKIKLVNTRTISKNPKQIDIDLTNLCNLNCSFCINDKIKKARGFMSEKLFKDIVDCIKNKFENKTILGIGLFGEPLLHSQFNNFISYASGKNLRIHISTNCVALNEDMAKAIIKAKMELIEISLYTLNKEKYESLVGYNYYDKVIKNIHYLLKLAEDNKFLGKIRLRPFEDNFNELADYEREFYQRYNKIYFDIKKPKKKRNWAGKISISNIFNGIYLIKSCEAPYERMAVEWDGEVKVCCQAMIASDLIVDKVTLNNDLFKVWNGEKFNNIRNDFYNLNYKSYPSCINCYDSKAFLNTYLRNIF